MDMNNSIKLVGYTELMLVDRETSKVVKYVKQENQLTEPFARWVLAGNLCVHNTSTATAQLAVESNPISALLGSTSLPHYQTVTTSLGTGKFGIYLMTSDVNIQKSTQIPPYVSASLGALSDSVAYYGSSNTSNDGKTMAPDNGSCRWSKVGLNPAYTTTYIKDDENTVSIKSVVLGARHDQRTGDSYSSYIMVRQSPVVLPPNWDNAWENAQSSSSTTLNAASSVSNFLVAPFLRTTLRDGRYGDGIYTISTEGGIGFFDLAEKEFETHTNGSPTVTNGITGETYTPSTSDSAGFVSSTHCGGGFAIGGSKAIRVTKGAETIVDGVGTVRMISLEYQRKLIRSDTVQSGSGTTTETWYGTYPNLTFTPSSLADIMQTVPETIYKNCAPVMVAIRGTRTNIVGTYVDPNTGLTVNRTEVVDDPTEDRIEIFCSVGVGTFTESTDAEGYHPGGTGIELQKKVIKINAFRESVPNTDFATTLINNVINYGRVAVLPYAVGTLASPTAGATPDTSMTGARYTFGTYDPVNEVYYLPITHIVNGLQLDSWTMKTDPTAADWVPVLCAKPDSQPGLIFDDNFTRLGDFMFAIAPCPGNGSGVAAARLAMLTTDDGYSPTIINSRQCWNMTQSLVMSGLTLPEPIEKTPSQILVVRYSYAFEILPLVPVQPSNFTVQPPDSDVATSLVVHWVPGERTERLRLRRSLYSTYSDETKLYVKSPLLFPDNGEYIDTKLRPNTAYFYRIRGENSSSMLAVAATDWTTVSAVTKPLIETVVTPSPFQMTEVSFRYVELAWAWNQPTPETDPLIANDITDYFDTYTLQYKLAPALAEGETEYASTVYDDPDGWTTVTANTNLQDLHTTSCRVTALTPKQTYLFRLRAEIEPSTYSNPQDAVSPWIGISQTMNDLPVPALVTDIVVRRTDYNYNVGVIEMSWPGQLEMEFAVDYIVDSEYTATPTTVADNMLVFNTMDADGATSVWSDFQYKIVPFNETHEIPEDVTALAAITSTGTSTGLALCRDGDSTVIVENNIYAGADLNNLILYENALGEPAVEGQGFTQTEISRLFAQGTIDGTPVSALLYGDTVANDTAVGYQKYIRIRLGITAPTLTAYQTVSWKFPFEILHRINGVAAEFPTGTRLRFNVYGQYLTDGEVTSEVCLGTLNNIPGIEGTTPDFSLTSMVNGIAFTTRNRTLAFVPTDSDPAINGYYDRYIAEWVIYNDTPSTFGTSEDATTYGGILLPSADDVLEIRLYMFAVIAEPTPPEPEPEPEPEPAP